MMAVTDWVASWSRCLLKHVLFTEVEAEKLMQHADANIFCSHDVYVLFVSCCMCQLSCASQRSCDLQKHN